MRMRKDKSVPFHALKLGAALVLVSASASVWAQEHPSAYMVDQDATSPGIVLRTPTDRFPLPHPLDPGSRAAAMQFVDGMIAGKKIDGSSIHSGVADGAQHMMGSAPLAEVASEMKGCRRTSTQDLRNTRSERQYFLVILTCKSTSPALAVGVDGVRVMSVYLNRSPIPYAY